MFLRLKSALFLMFVSGLLLGAFAGCGNDITVLASPSANTSSTDYLAMKVCVSSTDAVQSFTPLNCPSTDHLRGVRAGDLVPYYHADYPTNVDKNPCDLSPGGQSRRYAWISGTQVSDETGASYPLYTAWVDYPPHGQCIWSQPNPRDTVTFIALVSSGPNAGAWNVAGAEAGQYDYALGDAWPDAASQGVSRMLRTWGLPATAPAPGTMVQFNLPKHTAILTPTQLTQFQPGGSQQHGKGTQLSPTVEWVYRPAKGFVYGPETHQTQPLDTQLIVGFAKSNATADGPGVSTGSEHLYTSYEFGYVTRWEDWHREDNASGGAALPRAKTAYSYKNCGKPLSIEWAISPHFTANPVTLGTDLGAPYYYQDLTTADATSGTLTTHRWYLVGCHDFTNVGMLPNPIDVEKLVNTANINDVGGGTPAQAALLFKNMQK